MTPKDYTREYVGEVVDVNDPQHMMRVKVRVYDVFDGVPVGDLPWATYKLPFGVRPKDGGVVPVQVGDKVWVDFPFNGDTRRPRITGGVHFCPEEKPNLTPDIWQGDGQVEHKRTEDEPEPKTPGYHEDIAYRQHGVLLQVTKSGEIRATQLSSGSSIEVAADGSIVIHSENKILCSAPERILLKCKQSFIDMKPDEIIVKSGGKLRLNPNL